MAWGVRWYLVGSGVLGVLGALAGCSGGGFFDRLFGPPAPPPAPVRQQRRVITR